MYSDTAVIGLMSMEVVPGRLAGSAHGLACAMGQGVCLVCCIENELE